MTSTSLCGVWQHLMGSILQPLSDHRALPWLTCGEWQCGGDGFSVSRWEAERMSNICPCLALWKHLRGAQAVKVLSSSRTQLFCPAGTLGPMGNTFRPICRGGTTNSYGVGSGRTSAARLGPLRRYILCSEESRDSPVRPSTCCGTLIPTLSPVLG